MEQIIGKSILDQYFDEQTMSAHFKEFTPLLQKKGRPWNRQSVKSPNPFSKLDLEHIITQIFEEIKSRNDAFLEIDKMFSKVVQLGPYRIVIVYPPLADGLEMTVVKPVKKLTMEDYNLPSHIVDLLSNQAQGILISWAPGSWKTTFGQALIEMLAKKNKIIKTVESPRDLLVPDEVVQYSFSYGTHSEIRDILLLSRPDYTIYDEVRNTEDFQLYKDLRLTWIGLVGAIHATKPIDSIQRFLWIIEIWIIPQIIDTVIFIDAWMVAEILQLKLVVKVPQGMHSQDLARPVIQVTSFMTGKLLYEIYSFGEQIVVMPLEELASQKAGSSVMHFAQQYIQEAIHSMFSFDTLVSVLDDQHFALYVPEKEKGRVIGKGWENITSLEEQFGMTIDVKSFDEIEKTRIDPKDIEIKGKNSCIIHLGDTSRFNTVQIMVNDYLLSYRADAHGDVPIYEKWVVKMLTNQAAYLLNA